MIRLIGKLKTDALDENLVLVRHPIKLCDATQCQYQREHLIVSITKALDLIEQNDPKRMKRVEKYLSYIVSYHLLGVAQYEHSLQACYIDFNRIGPLEDKRKYILSLAGIIVHEATHGMIEARKIRFSKENRYRIERICHNEELKFLRRVAPDLSFPDFDSKVYSDYFKMTKLRLILDWLQHLNSTNKQGR